MFKKIKDTGLTMRKVGHANVAKALKATSAAKKINKTGSPAALFASRRHVFEDLKSTKIALKSPKTSINLISF